MASDASKGYLELTVDNGAIIPIGTIPPLTKPSAPGGGGGSIPAYSQKLQAENATGTGSYTGTIGDGTTRGPYENSSQYLEFKPTGVPTSANNYKLEVRIQTNYDTGLTGETGKMRIIVNGGTPQDVVTEGAAGGYRTYYLNNITLSAGDNNKIRFEGIFRVYFIDYIVITRPASS